MCPCGLPVTLSFGKPFNQDPGSVIDRLDRPNSTICGLDGDRCRPFDNHSFAFSCPADCESTKLLEPYVVGAKEINYRSLVVGGRNSRGPDTSVYRGDSFVCAAALHAGIISNEAGGCGIVSRVGEGE